MSRLDRFATDIAGRCRWACRHNGGHPSGAWSTGEQLAVALVLDDTGHLTRMGYTRHEAAQRVVGGMFDPPRDFSAWLEAIRTTIAAGDVS